MVDDSKLVTRLGKKSPIPVEVIPMALAPVTRRLEAMGGEPALRVSADRVGPVITDQGNLVVDVRFPSIEDPKSLESNLNNIPGVVENGLFVELADLVLIGLRADGTVKRMD
jgi:ribose 5-phosphate isomerase A